MVPAGEVTKTSDEAVDITFNVIEQTEFIDDSSLQPFRSGKTDPYYKRCAAVKIQSAEKLMYICKNQLGTCVRCVCGVGREVREGGRVWTTSAAPPSRSSPLRNSCTSAKTSWVRVCVVCGVVV